ncbi:MAG: hypothetical protein P8Y07_14100, partial [Gemmatimonadales bacterium]
DPGPCTDLQSEPVIRSLQVRQKHHPYHAALKLVEGAKNAWKVTGIPRVVTESSELVPAEMASAVWSRGEVKHHIGRSYSSK